MRIVFMGTPDFAVESLDRLVNAGFDVVGVVTATDKYGGRGGKKLIQSAVKKYAEAKGLKVLQPKNLKAEEFVSELRALKADLQVVVAFRMLPEVVWNMPPHGTLNIHGSLLPKYRGAAPINWAVIRGEKETGVTSFFLKHKIDTGNIILQSKMPIGPDDTAGDVHDKMMVLGADLLVDTVNAILNGEAKALEQDETEVTEAPKLFRETCEIDLNQDIQDVYNFVRGLSPFPTAWTMLEDKMLKIIKCKMVRVDSSESCEAVGTVDIKAKIGFKLWAQNGYLDIEELQIQGKRRMNIKDFLNGYNVG